MIAYNKNNLLFSMCGNRHDMREAYSQTCQLVAPDPLGNCCFLHHFTCESRSDFVLDL